MTEDTGAPFGQVLRDARKHAGMRRGAVARELGVSRGLLASWEDGVAAAPMVVRTRLAALYGVPNESLVPHRQAPVVESATITVGTVVFTLTRDGDSDATLRGFLQAVRGVRGVGAESELQVRSHDAELLAYLLGETPEAIAARLRELLDLDEEEADELAGWLLARQIVVIAAAVATVAALATGVGMAVSDDAETAPEIEVATAVVHTADLATEPAAEEAGDDELDEYSDYEGYDEYAAALPYVDAGSDDDSDAGSDDGTKPTDEAAPEPGDSGSDTDGGGGDSSDDSPDEDAPSEEDPIEYPSGIDEGNIGGSAELPVDTDEGNGSDNPNAHGGNPHADDNAGGPIDHSHGGNPNAAH